MNSAITSNGNIVYGTPCIINPYIVPENCTCGLSCRTNIRCCWCNRCNLPIANSFEKNSAKEEQIRPENVGPTGAIGPTGPTGATGWVGPSYPVETTKVRPEHHPVCNLPTDVNEKEPKIQPLNQNHLILGDWKGFVGNNLIRFRFEFTNQTNKVLAWYTVRTMDTIQPSGYSEGIEMISTKVRFNYLTNDLLIEDLSCGPICGWVTPTSIIGNTPTGNVLLTR